MPTISQWDGVRNNNSQSTVGSWSGSVTNYSSARFFGNGLMLPAAGGRDFYSSGALNTRGYTGRYWSSTQDSSSSDNAWYLRFSSSRATMYNPDRIYGYSVRCVAE